MKNILKRAGLALSVMSAVIMSSFNVYADGSANIAVPDSVSVGDSITVTVNVSCDSNIGTVAANLSYDETVLEFVSSDYASGGGGELVIPAAFPDSPTGDMSLDFSFKVIDEGEASLSVSGYVFDSEGTVIAELGASNTVSSGGEAVTQTEKETETETTTQTTPPKETEAPEQTTAEAVTQQTEPSVETVTAAPASGEETVKESESKADSTSASESSLDKDRNDLAKKLTIPLLIILATLIIALVIVTMWIRKKMKGKEK
ncbi:MAG: hypothetical protein IJ645_05645 [Ruminococcus sp.]|nr:hypothetical protein [Ruminococcus sp.]